MMLMIYIIAAVTAIGLAWLSLQITRLQPQSPGPWCAKCDYSLRGVSAWGKCPECGAELAKTTARFYPWALGRWRIPALITWTLSMFVLTACFERGVMLKYRPVGRHLMFNRLNMSTDQMFRFDAFYFATDWIVGSDDNGPGAGVLRLTRVPHPLRLSVWNYGGPQIVECRWDPSDQVLRYTIDGEETAIADGLSVRAFEQLATAAGIDLDTAANRTEIAEIVSLLRVIVFQEEPHSHQRTLISMHAHAPRGSGHCYTPWYLLIPLILLAGWIWWRGVKRIRSVPASIE